MSSARLSRGKVVWTYLERQRLAHEVAKLLQQHPDIRIIKAFRTAQKACLAPERHRELTTISLVGKDLLLQLEDAKKRLGRPALIAPVEAEPLVVPAQVLRIEVPVVPEMETVLTEVPTALLIGTLWARLASWIETSQKAWLAQAEKPARAASVPLTPRYPRVPLPPKPARLRVAIVGLWKEKILQEVAPKVAEKVEIIYVERERSQPVFPSAIDELIVITSAVKHRWFDAAQASMPKEHLHVVEGGASAVIKLCFDLASRQAPAKSSQPHQQETV